MLERCFIDFSWSLLVAFQTVSGNTRLCPFKDSGVISTEPLQEGFRVSVGGYTGHAAFSSLSDIEMLSFRTGAVMLS